MKDPIERQDALDAVRKCSVKEVTPAFMLVDKAEVMTELMMLSPARPERLTDDDFETIRIHLNAYKEKLCNQGRWKEAVKYQNIIDRFMTFAVERKG